MFNKSFLKVRSMTYVRRIGWFTLEDIYEVGHDKLKRLNGGAERDRTVGLLNAIQALSQLSYSPTKILNNTAQNTLSNPIFIDMGKGFSYS